MSESDFWHVGIYGTYCSDGSGSFRPCVVLAGWFRSGSFRPVLGVGRYGLGRWVVSALSHFGPISIW